LVAAWIGGGGPVRGGHTAGRWRQGTRRGCGWLRAVDSGLWLAGGAQSHKTGEVGALTGGPGALCRVLNWFKPSKSIQTRLNLFQIISNLIHSKKGLSKLKKFEIKYGFEGFAVGNNFIYRNFFRFKMDFELKFGEFKVCF
jgi:hypothetical protein